MKKTWLAALLAVSICGCAADKPAVEEPVTITNDVLINTTPADMSNYYFLDGDVADFQQITFYEAVRFFEEKGSGILYFGYDTCYWCNRAVPELNQVALETGVTVYYVNTSGILNYDDVDRLIPYIESTFGKNKDGNPEFYVPEVIGVKDGEITGWHISLVDSFTATGEDDRLTDKEKEELQGYYRDIILATAD